MTANLKQGACPQCGGDVEWESVILYGRELFAGMVPLCDECGDKQESTKEQREADEKWQNLFRKRMPEGYWRADPDQVSMWHSPALAWTEDDYPKGVGLIGKSGSGKSFTLVCLLRSLRVPFRWWTANDAREAALRASTSDNNRQACQVVWDTAMITPILVLDDISQCVFTEAWATKLFELLNARDANNLPTFWTCQINLLDLASQIIRQSKADNGEQAQAICRRLKQRTLEISTL